MEYITGVKAVDPCDDTHVMPVSSLHLRQGGDLRKSLFSGLVVVCVTQVVRCSSCYTYTIEHISLSQHTNQGHSPYMSMQRDDSSSECKDESKLHNKGARQTAPLQLLGGCRFVTHWAGGVKSSIFTQVGFSFRTLMYKINTK